MNIVPTCRAHIILFFGLSITFLADADWKQTNGPFAGEVNSLTKCGKALFAGTANGKIFRSMDEGSTWKNVGNDLRGHYIQTLASDSPAVYATLNDSGAAISTDNGEHWTVIGPDTLGMAFTTIAVKNGRIFIGTSSNRAKGIYYSSNNGSDWTSCNSGLTQTKIISLAISGNSVFAGTQDSGIFRSNVDTLKWVAVNKGIPLDTFYRETQDSLIRSIYRHPITDIAVAGASIFISSWQSGMFKSTDNGANWIPVGSGSTPPNITTCAVNGNTVFAGGSGVSRITENNKAWQQVDTGFAEGMNIKDCLASDGIVYAGTWRGMYRSIDNGAHWSEINKGFANTTVSTLLLKGGDVLAATECIGFGCFISRDCGTTWIESNSGLTTNGIRGVYSMFMSGSTIFAATDAGPLMYSTDYGKNWIYKLAAPFQKSDMSCFAMIGSTLIAGSMSDGFACTSDTGKSWNVINTGLPSYLYSAVSYPPIRSLVVKEGTVFGATDGNGVVRSIDTGKTWMLANNGLSEMNLTTIGLKNQTLFAGTYSSGMYRSSDNGNTWTSANNGVTKKSIYAFALHKNTILAGGDGGSVFISTDNGTRWNEAGKGLPYANIISFALNDSIVYAGTEGRSVWSRPLSELIAATGNSQKNPNWSREKVGVEIYRIPGKPFSFELKLSHPNPVSVTISDLSGRTIMKLVEKVLPPGIYRYTSNAGMLPAGCYIVKVRAGNEVLLKSIAAVPVF